MGIDLHKEETWALLDSHNDDAYAKKLQDEIKSMTGKDLHNLNEKNEIPTD